MRILLVTGLFIVLIFNGFSQSIEDLRKKKLDAENEIKYTSKLLNEVQKVQKASLSRIRLLNNQISQRNKVINTMSGEIDLYQQMIENNLLACRTHQAGISQPQRIQPGALSAFGRKCKPGLPALFIHETLYKLS
jgi:TolA-binding protein